MPQSLQVPAWYNDDNYISEKVKECNMIKFGHVEGQDWTEWTPESVRSFIAQVNDATNYAPWMGYENFVNFGNAENASPNPLFNVMEYCTAKANQLNAMNGGAGYEGINAWTAVSVLKYFNDHNITAWDHFTLYGQFEYVNPSNAMDLSEFLVNKAEQCNGLAFAGKTDWTPEAVLTYYKDHGLNAVEVAVNSDDPNVVPVTGDEVVTAPSGMTPWSIISLTTDDDVMGVIGVPISYVATVGGSAADTTLNAGDQITGGSEEDTLTVNLASNFGGLNKEGFVKDVPIINVNNTTESVEALAFNATGITGVKTWNVDGNVNLEGVEETGITINYKNVNLSEFSLGFAEGATDGKNDSLTIGVDNVYYVERFNSSGIENVTVNATGEYSYIRCFIEDMETLTITGDARLGIRGASADLKTVDASSATGNVALCTRMADNLESFQGGSGNDSVSMQKMASNCVINGGEGNDTITLVNAAGAFKYQMDSIETLAVRVSNNLGDWMPDATVKDASSSLALDGSNTTGLQTLALKGGNGWDFITPANGAVEAREISLTNYVQDQLNINVTGQNNVRLAVDSIKDVTINLGDNDASTADVLNGLITLPDATTVAVNLNEITETLPVDPNNFSFKIGMDAASATSLSLTSGQNTPLLINDGNLSSVSNLKVSGDSGVIVSSDAQLAKDVSTVSVNAEGLRGGYFDGSFVGNTTNGGASLNYTGATGAQNLVTVDGSYTRVNVTGGSSDDTLNIYTTNLAAGQKITITGDLGGGNDKVIVHGSSADVDVTGLANAIVSFVGVEETSAAPVSAA